MTATVTPALALAAHAMIWDMPTLAQERPDVFAWLSERVFVDFDMASEVVLGVYGPEGTSFRRTGTKDVRVAVLKWLAEEVDV